MGSLKLNIGQAREVSEMGIRIKISPVKQKALFGRHRVVTKLLFRSGWRSEIQNRLREKNVANSPVWR